MIWFDLNSVLFGCPQKHAARLRRVQQALARVVTQQSSVSPLTSTERLKELHWLPVEWRIRLKLACLVHKILNTGHAPYLTELLQYHKPARSTRSSASHLLSVPRHNLSFGARAFGVAAPKIWNSIPLHICQSQTYSSFTRHLKTSDGNYLRYKNLDTFLDTLRVSCILYLDTFSDMYLVSLSKIQIKSILYHFIHSQILNTFYYFLHPYITNRLKYHVELETASMTAHLKSCCYWKRTVFLLSKKTWTQCEQNMTMMNELQYTCMM